MSSRPQPRSRTSRQGRPTADPARVTAALAVIPNDHEPLKGYAVPSKGSHGGTTTGTPGAIWASPSSAPSAPTPAIRSSMHGHGSRRSTATRHLAEWKDIRDYPPNEITAASIFYRANLENPRWPVLIGNSIEAAIEINDLAVAGHSVRPAAQGRGEAPRDARRHPRRSRRAAASRSGGDADDDKQGQEISFKPPEPWPDRSTARSSRHDRCPSQVRDHVRARRPRGRPLGDPRYALDAAEHSPASPDQVADLSLRQATLIRGRLRRLWSALLLLARQAR